MMPPAQIMPTCLTRQAVTTSGTLAFGMPPAGDLPTLLRMRQDEVDGRSDAAGRSFMIRNLYRAMSSEGNFLSTAVQMPACSWKK
jgi:hypothetical protein